MVDSTILKLAKKLELVGRGGRTDSHPATDSERLAVIRRLRLPALVKTKEIGYRLGVVLGRASPNLYFGRQSGTYLEMFFSTELGSKLLSELLRGMLVRSISPRDLERLVVPVPTLEEQNELLEAKSRIDQLAEVLDRLESQLAANPKNTEAVNTTVISALNELGRVTAAEKGKIEQGQF